MALPLLLLAGTLVAVATPRTAADQVAEARRYYNQSLYELAIKSATDARDRGVAVDDAALVIARAHLERFRQTRDTHNLTAARDALRVIDATKLTAEGPTEFAVALGQWLFLDDKFRAAAELFDGVVTRVDALGPAARDRVLDWWATSVDRQAQTDAAQRQALYQRIIERMDAELRNNPGSTSAGYWVAAAARSAGDIERAWHAALAGYLRARLAADRGAALRADLDQLVTTAIIPERARHLTAPGVDVKPAVDAMTTEWEHMKSLWN